MHKLTEAEVHYTPEIIKDAAEVIGRIHSDAQNSLAKRAPATVISHDLIPESVSALAFKLP